MTRLWLIDDLDLPLSADIDGCSVPDVQCWIELKSDGDALRFSENVDAAIWDMLIGPWLLDETMAKEYCLTCDCAVGSGAFA